MKFPKLKGKFILAPMAGVTDIAFRELCVKYGAAMTFTELVSSDALTRGASEERIRRSKKEKVFGIQVFGSNAESVANAAILAQELCDVVDFNLGCAAWSITRQNGGSSLLKEPEKIKLIINRVIRSINKPFTIKIRSGYSDKNLNFIEVGKLAESLGVSAITLHARSAKQRFSGKANWDHIKQLKNAVDIPVIGNGDVVTPEDAVRMLKETGCDYVMIGRAAQKNPYIFKQANDLLKKGKYQKLSLTSKVKLFKQYLKLAKNYEIPFIRIKSHAIQIISEFEGSKQFRIDVMHSDSTDSMLNIIDLFKTFNKKCIFK